MAGMQVTQIPWRQFVILSKDVRQLTGEDDLYFSFAQCYGFVLNNNTKLVSSGNVSDVMQEMTGNTSTLTPEHQQVMSLILIARTLREHSPRQQLSS